jgi:5'-nucleotidase
MKLCYLPLKTESPLATRRTFIKQLASGSALLAAGSFPVEALAGGELTRLTILHTNDMHSRIDPFPETDKRYAGMGGVSQRAALVKAIRAENEHVLLLDSGDIFQGTPYFNFYGGEVEFKAMSAMGYDAATMGNHDFDAGLEGFNLQLPHADFPFLVANYDFSDTLLNKKIKKYKVFKRGPLKIGVFGLGIELDGLVPKALYGHTRYLDPISNAQQTADLLRYDEKCDLVICLSHLGFRYEDKTVSDEVLAAETDGIDCILGGHTHTFFDQAEVYKNRSGSSVLINQVGWGGVYLGRLDIICDRVKKKKWLSQKTVIVTKKSRV